MELCLLKQKMITMEKILDRSVTTRELVFGAALIACLTPWVSPPVALLLGLVIALFVGHPFLHLNHKATHILLQLSVVGLGFGMNAGIAAISPVIKAEEKQISVALGTVFLLNSIALFLFPVVGHLLHLSQTQFGLWAAIAIHDTSSVVGAAGKYGPQALEVATTVKLARALWIIPVAVLAALFFKTGKQKIKIPYFIGAFIGAMVLNTYLPMPVVSHVLVQASKVGLTLTLFLIGSGLSRQVLRNTGVRPLLQGILLWGLISGFALWAVIRLAV